VNSVFDLLQFSGCLLNQSYRLIPDINSRRASSSQYSLTDQGPLLYNHRRPPSLLKNCLRLPKRASVNLAFTRSEHDDDRPGRMTATARRYNV
jgi:hypothetical protein